MYHKDTWQYLTSGETVAELVESFEERFPTRERQLKMVMMNWLNGLNAI
jgi:hypothetical protein